MAKKILLFAQYKGVYAAHLCFKMQKKVNFLQTFRKIMKENIKNVDAKLRIAYNEMTLCAGMGKHSASVRIR